MSKHKPDAGITELKDFIRSVQIDVSGLNESTDVLKRLYKNFYSILIVDYALQASLPEGAKRSYAREAISDISHGIFLSLIGIYKPARISLRSGIENFIRLAILIKDVNALEIKDVSGLFEKANQIYNNDVSQKRRLGDLRSVYVELCKTVHSTDTEYMNLSVPFSSMLDYDRKKFEYNSSQATECCQKIVQFLFVEVADEIQKLHHSLRDTIYDSVPKSVKAELRERKER